jgi:hypothetical protein
MSTARKNFARLARKSSAAYPVATVSYYGPDNQRASKVAVGIVDAFERVIPLQRWYASEHDIRADEPVFEQMVAFMTQHNATRVIMADRIIGCPHEEGIDYPDGESCPQCPFWKNRDRWTGELLA